MLEKKCCRQVCCCIIVTWESGSNGALASRLSTWLDRDPCLAVKIANDVNGDAVLPASFVKTLVSLTC